jgi:hypothetical protein
MDRRLKIELFNGFCQSNNLIDQHDLFFRNIFYVLDRSLCCIERLDIDIATLQREYRRHLRYHPQHPEITVGLPQNMRYDFDYLLSSLTPIFENTVAKDMNKYFDSNNLKKHKPSSSEAIKVIKQIYDRLRNNSVHYNDGNFGSQINPVGNRPLIYVNSIALNKSSFPPSLWIDNATPIREKHMDFFIAFSSIKNSLYDYIDSIISTFAIHFSNENPQVNFDEYMIKKK